MYGTPQVLGAVTPVAGSIAVLPNTGGNKVAAAITLATLIIGSAILVITVTRTLAAKIFA
jgi:LPXTG-motif cell wall-anchored protein